MRTRLFLTLLITVTILVVILAVSYDWYPMKEARGTVRDAQGNPIPNASVIASGRTTQADSDGRFSLLVPHGTTTIASVADGFGRAEKSVTIDSFLDKDVDVDLLLPPNVFTATVHAADVGRPIAGARVDIKDGVSLTTDASGSFTAHGVKTGTPLVISASGYLSQTFQFAPDGPHDFSLSPALTTIRVLDEYTQLPLPSTAISAGGPSVPANDKGELLVRSLAPGTTVTARLAGYGEGSATYNGETTLTFSLVPNALDGVIQDASTGKPIPHAQLMYTGVVTQTDESGVFELEKPTSELTITVKVPGYRLATVPITRTAHITVPLQPFKAKGLHIYYAQPRDSVVALLDGLVGTEVNAVVLDVKEGAGEIVWPSEVPLAKQLGAYHDRGIPPSELVQICRQRNWYCIARQVIFKDIRLGSARPDLALHYMNWGLYNQGNEIWMNPAKKEIWDYNLALAKELIAMGFDEVQFDYIRYPGSPLPVEAGDAADRIATIKSFLQYVSAAIKPLPAFLSGDLFGLTVAAHDDQGIGQIIEEDGPFLDFISPMMYPSTWKGAPNLFRDGLNNPDCYAALACPYDIIYHGTLQGQERGKTLVRPWLQAYQDGGFYVNEYIAQKKGADDANSSGWLFWNNQGLYPDAMWAKAPAQ